MLLRILAVALLAGLGGAWYLALPPGAPSAAAPPPDARQELRGALHVHTTRSDGTGTVVEVAAAAARAGLDFVVFTDHGDATLEPDPPQYRERVLCIDAVEISTQHGHLLALGLPQAPYPFAGEARDVIADVARLGGFAIAAHPDSVKDELGWTDWRVPVEGLEWLNGDSEWRDESGWTLARALFTYPARGLETLAALLDRPEMALRRWDELTQQRKVVALAGADAHARIGLRSLGEPYDNSASFHVPSYERMFRLFSNVLPETTLTGDPAADARTVLAALRAGVAYSRVDALGAATLAFAAADGRRRVRAGEAIPTAGPVTLRVDLQGLADARIDLLRGGAVVATAAGAQLEHVVGPDAPGAYRVEVSHPGAPGRPPVPWIVSNPIYVGRTTPPAAPPAPAVTPAASAVTPKYTNGPAMGWTVEVSPASQGALDVVAGGRGTELALRYALGGAASASPFAAFVMAAGPGLADHTRLVFTARADRAMRLSVQLREPAGEEGIRWRRSVFLDPTAREIAVAFDDLRPAGRTPHDRPILANVDAVMFVVDTLNTPLGGNGRIWIDDVRYAR